MQISNGLRWLLTYVGYVFVLLVLATTLRDAPVEPGVQWVKLDELSAGQGDVYSDPAYHATAALDIYEHGWLRPENVWIFKFWPPGLAFLQVTLVSFFGPDVPMILALQIMACLAFGFVLSLVQAVLKPAVPPLWAFLLPLVPFAAPTTRAFLIQPIGVSFGETFGVAFFLSGTFLCVLALRSIHPLRVALLAGACLGLSAYFQTRFEPFITVLIAGGVTLILLQLARVLRLFSGVRLSLTAMLIMAVSLLAAQATMLPWRLHHVSKGGSLQWSQTPGLAYLNSLRTSDDLISIGGEFVVAGGGNLVCRLEPTTCGDAANAEEHFWSTFLARPGDWIAQKIALLPKYWFAPIDVWTHVSSAPTTDDIIFNAFVIISILAVLIAPLTLRSVGKREEAVFIIWFGWALFAGYAAILTLFHFEVRYFFFGKVAFPFLFLLLIAVAARGGPQTSTGSSLP